ncbi:facilitated trehalose transporter Tret1-like [Danaus plexippus]|uniref:facilitated trehalose transporter Tret1-like n=1 Tax=Danaus plexippus TaxID=13037 RepID=UPI002AB30142|nr:facilitated trehalose transporter Tret1-like [Danaus plexippus]
MSLLSDRYFWRQGLVFFADLSYSINTGFMLSFPSLLNAAILSPNTTDIRATNDQASSIAGSQGLSGVIGFCLLPFLLQSLGRKVVNIGINAIVGVGFLVFVLANNIAALYAARMIQGLSICGVYVTIITLAEYCNAKRRGYFITLKKGSVAIGSLMCHSMGLFWTWRQVAAFAIIPNIIAIFMTFFWPESPPFLAMKGRYSECEKSYKWLHGEGSEVKKDFEAIISAQMERRTQEKNKMSFKTTFLKIFRKDYLLPFVVVNLLTLIIDCCGRYYTLAYIVQIVIDITGDASIATYCTIGSDLLTVVALACSCFIVSTFKRRQNLFTFGAISVILMFLTSIVTYFRTEFNISINVWLAPIIILTNIFVVNAGVIPTCFAIVSEIFPIEHKGSGLCTTGIVFTLLYAGVMKFTPMLMEHTGVHGTFAIYATLNLVSFVILYFILIETKDRTLQEIEDELKGIKKRDGIYPYNNDQLLKDSEKI